VRKGAIAEFSHPPVLVVTIYWHLSASDAFPPIAFALSLALGIVAAVRLLHFPIAKKCPRKHNPNRGRLVALEQASAKQKYKDLLDAWSSSALRRVPAQQQTDIVAPSIAFGHGVPCPY